MLRAMSSAADTLVADLKRANVLASVLALLGWDEQVFLPPESAARLRAGFAARAGATRCRPLKRGLRFPCTDCVGLAAELLAGSSASSSSASQLPSSS